MADTVPLRPTTGGLLRRHAIEPLRHREIIEEVQRSGDERLAFHGVAGFVGDLERRRHGLAPGVRVDSDQVALWAEPVVAVGRDTVDCPERG